MVDEKTRRHGLRYDCGAEAMRSRFPLEERLRMRPEDVQEAMDAVDCIFARQPHVRERTAEGLCCGRISGRKRKGAKPGRFCRRAASHVDRFGVGYCEQHRNPNG